MTKEGINNITVKGNNKTNSKVIYDFQNNIVFLIFIDTNLNYL